MCEGHQPGCGACNIPQKTSVIECGFNVFKRLVPLEPRLSSVFIVPVLTPQRKNDSRRKKEMFDRYNSSSHVLSFGVIISISVVGINIISYPVWMTLAPCGTSHQKYYR